VKKPRLLIVDCAPAAAQFYQPTLAELGADRSEILSDRLQALERLKADRFDLLVAAICPDRPEGLSLVEALSELDAELPIIVVTDRPTVESAIASVRLGVGDYLSRQQVPAELAASVRRVLAARRLGAENALLRRQIERPYSVDDMIGGCAPMRKVFDLIEQVADSDVDVLVVGETGTGKELVARAIHRRSGREAAPFVPVDYGAIPENLLESEFFGYEKGAFTGADSKRIGLVEFADRGTFFLDELGELPLLLQAKLLRMLQERRIRRVGGREELDVDVRIVAATARALEDMIREGRFREDLFYRINVVRIDLPPLRERGDDIGLLAEHMAFRHGREMDRDIRGITPEAYQVLANYRWPGNVRQLQNVIRRGIALTRGTMIGVEDLPDEVVASAGEGQSSAGAGYFAARDEHAASFERQYLAELLGRHKGDVRAAAREALLPRGTLYRLMKKHDLESGGFR